MFMLVTKAGFKYLDFIDQFLCNVLKKGTAYLLITINQYINGQYFNMKSICHFMIRLQNS